MKIAFSTPKIGDHNYHDVVSLAETALKMKHDIYWFDYHDVFFYKKKPYASCVRVRKVLDFDKGHPLARGKKISICLDSFDSIVFKKEPRLDKDVCRIFEKVDSHVLMVNDPCGILKYDGKAFLKNFPKLTAPSYYSKDVGKLKGWIRKHKNVVLKDPFGSGGKGVYHLFMKGNACFVEKRFGKPKKIDLDGFLKKMVKKGEVVLVVYLKHVVDGDKRIIVLDNKIIGSFLRLPGKSNWVCNVSSGGKKGIKSSISLEERKMVKKVAPYLSHLGLRLVGYDTLMGDKGKRVLSEVNVFNVEGIKAIGKLYDRDASKEVIKWIEGKVK